MKNIKVPLKRDVKISSNKNAKISLMRNMKISFKLITGFIIVVIFAVAVGILGVIGMQQLSKADTSMYTDCVLPIRDYGSAALSYEQARVSAMSVVLAAKSLDIKAVDKESSNYNTKMEQFIILFNEAGQKASSEEEKQLYEESLELFEKYFKPSFDKVVKFAIAGGDATNELKIAFALTEKLGENINALFAMNVSDANSTQKDNADLASRLTLYLIIVLIAAAFISILLALYIQRLIVKPIDNLVHSASEIRKGNLDVFVDTTGKDEIGKLSRYFASVVDTLKNVINGIQTMSETHLVGEMDSRIDEKTYNGAFKEVVSGINNMVTIYVNILHDIFDVLKGFGNGDFSVPFKQLPGQQAAANVSVEHMRSNLNDINNEIIILAQSVVAGKLSVRTNAGNFEGDWSKLLFGLNMVMDAVVQPINETMSALESIAEGDLSIKVYGKYQGDFEKIKLSFNKTVDNLNLYIGEISKVLRALSNNDFDQSITREYVGDFIEIKYSLNKIVEKLNYVMREITNSTLQVAAGAKQISKSSVILAEGATQQASTVEILTSSVTMVNEQTQKNAESADNANNLAEASMASAQNGNLEMQNMLGAMDSIKESSNNISKIIKVIDDIAFQTNLLALNAAVEAARAGEHGKGFAVVAEEVRNLAARSQKAAKETSVMIEESIDRVKQGTQIATNTSLALDKIVSDATVLSDIISNIAAASVEQADSIKGITDGLNLISDVVQSNSATAEESAASAEQLTCQVETLNGILSNFNLKKV